MKSPSAASPLPSWGDLSNEEIKDLVRIAYRNTPIEDGMTFDEMWDGWVSYLTPKARYVDGRYEEIEATPEIIRKGVEEAGLTLMSFIR